MLGVMLLLLVILNAFATGWLLAKVREMRKVVESLGNVTHDMALGIADVPQIQRGPVES